MHVDAANRKAMSMSLYIADEPAPVVCPAYNHNHERLIEIDRRTAELIDATAKADQTAVDRSSRIVAAGVEMLRVWRDDPTAFDAFRKDDPLADSINCKGTNAETRTIAEILWRRHKTEASKRERISVYGRAIGAAARAFAKESGDPLVSSIQSVGGVKGVIRTDKTSGTEAHKPKPLRFRVDRPDAPILIVVFPDGTIKEFSPEVARPILIQLEVIKPEPVQ